MRTNGFVILFAVAAGLAASGGSAVHAQPAGLDGTYRTGSDGATYSGPGCTNGGVPPIRVKDGVATMQTARFGTFEGKIAADGSISILMGKYSLTGKFAEGHFKGGLGFPSCNVGLVMARG